MTSSPDTRAPATLRHPGSNPLDLAHPLQVGGGDPGAPGAGEITLAAGLYVQRLPAAGLSVGEIRTRFRARMAIEDRAVAVVDGVEVGPETLVRAGQTLTFVRRAGERG